MTFGEALAANAKLGRVRALLAGVSAAVLVVAGAACDGDKNHADRIAFTVNRNGFGEIWLMNGDRTDRRRLTPEAPAGTDASGSTSPSWSPDGRRIVYMSSGEETADDPSDVEIYVMRADGDQVRRLTADRILDADPAWSPDGRRVAFAHAPGWGTERADVVVVAVEVASRRRTQVTHHPPGSRPVFDFGPAWSPRGLIAFTRSTFAPAAQTMSAIYTIRPDGAGERLLVAEAAEPAWSPDGEWIAFTSARDENGETCSHECYPSGELYLARADGSGIRRLTHNEADDRSPAWSPDGSEIAFVSDRSGRRTHENEIWVIGRDGSGLRRLTANSVWDLDPAWSPAG